MMPTLLLFLLVSAPAGNKCWTRNRQRINGADAWCVSSRTERIRMGGRLYGNLCDPTEAALLADIARLKIVVCAPEPRS